MAKKRLTMAKAKQILHEGTARGRPITERQRGFFGAASRPGFRGSRNPTSSVPWTPSAMRILKETESPVGST